MLMFWGEHTLVIVLRRATEGRLGVGKYRFSGIVERREGL